MGDDPVIEALVITGAGTAFCSGGDVEGMGGRGALKAETPFEEKVALLRERQHADGRPGEPAQADHRRAAGSRRPAPGLRSRLACDLRIAAKSAIMATGFAGIGLTGDYGVSWLLARLAGTSRARGLMFLADKIDARRCGALGLVNRVVPDADLQSRSLRAGQPARQWPEVRHMRRSRTISIWR